MAPRKSREIDISGRTVHCDSVDDRALLTHAKAIIKSRDAAIALSLEQLQDVLGACRLYALGEGQHAVREVIASRPAQARSRVADTDGDQ